jgi:hypothetical protein
MIKRVVEPSPNYPPDHSTLELETLLSKSPSPLITGLEKIPPITCRKRMAVPKPEEARGDDTFPTRQLAVLGVIYLLPKGAMKRADPPF